MANLGAVYDKLGHDEKSLCMHREVYAGRLALNGEESFYTLIAANSLAGNLIRHSFEEAKAFFRTVVPIARRVLGEGHDLTLTIRINYTRALYEDPDATLDDLREAETTTLVETERTARRILGSAHPLVDTVEQGMRDFRELRAIHELRASMK